MNQQLKNQTQALSVAMATQEQLQQEVEKEKEGNQVLLARVTELSQRLEERESEPRAIPRDFSFASSEFQVSDGQLKLQCLSLSAHNCFSTSFFSSSSFPLLSLFPSSSFPSYLPSSSSSSSSYSSPLQVVSGGVSQADSEEWKMVRPSASGSSSEGKGENSPPPEILSLHGDTQEHGSPSSDKVL